VHLTRRFDGEVLVGPNAVMALAKEGYRWRDVAPRDLAELAAWSGTWRLARRHWRTGVRDTPKRAASSVSVTRMPGGSEPSRSAARIWP